jgi:phosphatidylinositol 4-kinase
MCVCVCVCVCVCTKAKERQLLHAICWAPIRLFSQQSVEAAVVCWQWLLAACPDISLQLMQEIAAVWQTVVDMRLGLFSDDGPVANALIATQLREKKTSEDISAGSGGSTSSPPPPPTSNVQPHMIWIKFLMERLEVAKYASQDEVNVSYI